THLGSLQPSDEGGHVSGHASAPGAGGRFATASSSSSMAIFSTISRMQAAASLMSDAIWISLSRTGPTYFSSRPASSIGSVIDPSVRCDCAVKNGSDNQGHHDDLTHVRPPC